MESKNLISKYHDQSAQQQGALFNKSITRSLITFKKPRKITNDFFDHYIFVRTFQWTLSECLNNVTITAEVAMVAYIQGENG